MLFQAIFVGLVEETADDREPTIPIVPCLGADLPNPFVQHLPALESPDFSLQPFIELGMAVTPEVKVADDGGGRLRAFAQKVPAQTRLGDVGHGAAETENLVELV